MPSPSPHVAPYRRIGPTPARRVIALGLAAAMFAIGTPVLAGMRHHLSFASDLAIYLLVVVITSVIGGFYPAVAAALVGDVLLNYYFTSPLHTLSIDRSDNVIAVVIFLAVAILVSRVVDTSVRRSAVAALAESERARTALLNAVSHDLRTPLAAAKASVTSLQGDVAWSDTDHAELVDSADAALDRLTSLVTNLLDLSRLQAGVLPVLSAPLGLEDVVSRALDHAMPPAIVRDPDAPIPAAIAVSIPDDLPEVLADAGLLERVIANLVENASRYAPEGSQIEVSGVAKGANVELHVIDHGPGIGPEDRTTVFAPFQRRDDTPVAGAGAGLGLAIARGFTEAMNGTIAATATPGGGATFVVSLPAARWSS